MLVAACFLMLSACATTHSSTEPVNYAPAGYKISRLIAVAFTDDVTARMQFEDGFAGSMNSHGLLTEVSYKVMPKLEDLADDRKLEEAKTGSSADTSILIEVVDQNDNARAVRNTMLGVWIAGIVLGDDDLRRVGAVSSLAAEDAAARYKLRVTLWNMTDNSLLWSSDIESYVLLEADTQESGAILADTMVVELRKSGLI